MSPRPCIRPCFSCASFQTRLCGSTMSRINKIWSHVYLIEVDNIEYITRRTGKYLNRRCRWFNFFSLIIKTCPWSLRSVDLGLLFPYLGSWSFVLCTWSMGPKPWSLGPRTLNLGPDSA